MLNVLCLFVLVAAIVVGGHVYARRVGLRGVRELTRDMLGRLYPAERASASRLQKAAWRGIRAELMVGVDGVVAVPTRFDISLHPEDYDTVSVVEEWFTGGLCALLARGASEHAWKIADEPVLLVGVDGARTPGVPLVRGAFGAGSRDGGHATALIGARPVGADEVTVRAAGPLLVDNEGGAWIVGNGDTIGRSDDCDIVLADAAVSGRHCRLEIDPLGGWVLVDLSSSNGTTLNGRRVRAGIAHRLDDGDEIVLGRTTLRLLLTANIADGAPRRIAGR